MSEQEKRKGGGGKLTRSETVTVRLDPKLRYLAELAARKQRRTLSSFIEWAVEDSLNRVYLREYSTIADEAGGLWDLDPSDRLIKLAESHPDLLTYEEQRIWKAIHSIAAGEAYQNAEGKNSYINYSFVMGEGENRRPEPYAIRNCWLELVAYSEGKATEEDLQAALREKSMPF